MIPSKKMDMGDCIRAKSLLAKSFLYPLMKDKRKMWQLCRSILLRFPCTSVLVPYLPQISIEYIRWSRVSRAWSILSPPQTWFRALLPSHIGVLVFPSEISSSQSKIWDTPQQSSNRRATTTTFARSYRRKCVDTETSLSSPYSSYCPFLSWCGSSRTPTLTSWPRML